MKRHVINRFGRRVAFKQSDRDAVIPDGDAIVELEFFPQPQRALKPFRALFRIAHSQAEVADFSNGEWNFHA
jgi:hypothetical protein